MLWYKGVESLGMGSVDSSSGGGDIGFRGVVELGDEGSVFVKKPDGPFGRVPISIELISACSNWSARLDYSRGMRTVPKVLGERVMKAAASQRMNPAHLPVKLEHTCGCLRHSSPWLGTSKVQSAIKSSKACNYSRNCRARSYPRCMDGLQTNGPKS